MVFIFPNRPRKPGDPTLGRVGWAALLFAALLVVILAGVKAAGG